MEFVNAISYCFYFAIFIMVYSLIKANERRMTKIEQKIDLLLQQFEDDDPNSDLESVENYLIRGDRLQAIKRLRELNPGSSLKEAIEVVTALEQEIQK
jgi:flagellar biosynthesis regulator FlbT